MTAFDDPQAFVNRVREQAADAERSGDIPRLLQLVNELATAFERQARSTAADNAEVARAVEEFERHRGHLIGLPLVQPFATVTDPRPEV